MNYMGDFLRQYKGYKIALYGLGTETERFLADNGAELDVVGLLDGFREDGEIFGYPIISLREAIDGGVTIIIVIARPGSCKAIVKRIGQICRDNNIALYDVRGRDLLVSQAVAYDFADVKGYNRKELISQIEQYDIISFDLFDTLVMRKVFNYSDLFELLECRLKEKGVCVPDFARLRLSVEKECSKYHAPNLTEIYDNVLKRASYGRLSSCELADMEWELDYSLMTAREAVCALYRDAVRDGKRVVITTDSYYSYEQIRNITEKFGLEGFSDLIISCELGTSKTQSLYEALLKMNDMQSEGILHIGDDEAADIGCAGIYGIHTFRIFSGSDLFDFLGGLGTNEDIISLSDRIKTGLFVSRIFNDPFVFEDEKCRLSVLDAHNIGYLFCAPLIVDFTLWFKEEVIKENISQVLFCARDGYFIDRLYHKIDNMTQACYFLTSRTAAVRAGMENDEDISYVDSMKYFGSDEDNLRVRFGIEKSAAVNLRGRNEIIIKRSAVLRENYKRYIERLGVWGEKIAMFDFVAKGTTQMYLNRLFEKNLKGFYFLQLEPEFMSDKGLDIISFYSDAEKDTSAIYDNYYILETILTAPYPQLIEFDGEGNPVYLDETRSESDIGCLNRVHVGIEEFFDDYISILPEGEWKSNKRLDEILLSLINKVKIKDVDFMSLMIEDPFFGRMTAVADVLGG